jgi:hypothetical protein
VEFRHLALVDAVGVESAARLSERGMQDVRAGIAARETEAAADQLARGAEIEATRQGAWRMWDLDTEQIIAMKGYVSAPWIEAHMPKEGWPPGDGLRSITTARSHRRSGPRTMARCRLWCFGQGRWGLMSSPAELRAKFWRARPAAVASATGRKG